MSPRYDLDPASKGGEYYGPGSYIITYSDWIRGRWFAFVGSERLSAFVSSSEPARSDGFPTERALLDYLETTGCTAGKKRSEYPKDNSLTSPETHLSR